MNEFVVLNGAIPLAAMSMTTTVVFYLLGSI